MESLKPVAMNFESGNISENYKRWSQHMRLILSGPLADKSELQQCSYFLLYIGQAGRDIFNTWSLPDEEENKIEVLFTKFGQYCQPKKNVTMARFKFNSRSQHADESVDQFTTELRLIANDCEFEELKDSLIRDRIICGTRDEKVRERLLQEEDISLSKAIDLARSMEVSRQQMTSITNAVDMKAVHIRHKKQSSNRSAEQEQCPNCGQAPHPFARCPAKNKTCNYCKKPNHFSKMCRKLAYNKQNGQRNHQQHRERQRGRAMHELKADDTDDEEFTFQALTINSLDTQDEIYTKIKVILPDFKNSTLLKVKVDTGAQGNALPLRIYKKMYPSDIGKEGQLLNLQPSSKILKAYGGHRIKQYGTCIVKCEHEGVQYDTKFYITEDDGSAILGLPSAQAMQLITVNCEIKTDEQTGHISNKTELIQQYPNVFDGIGKMQGQYHININPNVPPTVHAPRKVPIALRDRIKSELDEMERQGVITKVQEGKPTVWVNSLVYREKANGRLRVCLDPKDLNRAILREHHVTPTLEELIPSLTGAQYFSICDAKCGYWNIELDEESSYLTTFNSPFGRYRFNRMPYGLKMSQDIFQAKIDQTFEGCPGVIGIADDIVIYGKTESEHDQNLRKMINRCQKSGLKLNPNKCKIKQDKIKFYGIICSKDGIKPDPAKVSVLKEMKSPQNQQELQSFLGLTTYMGKFIPKTSILTAPLRELLKENTHFQWNASHEAAFNDIKAAISDDTTLVYFDSKKPITLQVDASMKGIGAALLQEGRPVAFASKSLSDEETRYANIEREMLAVVYGCERFHTYLYGQTFTVESDHKPLESIQLKHLRAAPPRLQRMLLRIQPYNLTIKYIPGKDMKIADPLSRLSNGERKHIEGLNDVRIHSIMTQFSDNVLQRIKDETSKDAELNALKEIVYTGWPEHIHNVPHLCHPYWNYRDEIGLEEGILLKSRRIIIPKIMHNEILQKLHEPHLGIEKTLLRARTTVFWKNITKDIESMIKECHTCQIHQSSQKKEPLIQTEIPPRPWHTIGTDIFYLKGNEYLLISDYYSKYPFVRKIPRGENTSSKIVILTKQILSEHGIPEIIRSDNGPQFSGRAYKEFIKQYGITHKTSSPHYPQSNGYIESQVKIVKRTLTKSFETETDPFKAMLALRSTPIDHNLPSPGKILLGRDLNDGLPRKPNKDTSIQHTTSGLEKRQQSQAFYYNRKAYHLPPLSTGQTVTYQNQATKKWEPALILNKHASPRSYNIITPDGSEFRRNRNHIRFIPKQWHQERSQNIPIPVPKMLVNNQQTTEQTQIKTTTKQVKPQCLPACGQDALERAPVRDNAILSQTQPHTQTKTSYITRSGRSVKIPNRYTM